MNFNQLIDAKNMDAVKEMIPDITKEELQSGLNYATRKSTLDMVKVLVQAGADPAYDNSHALLGATLMKSPLYGNLEIIEYLVESGADIQTITDTAHPIIMKWIDKKLNRKRKILNW